MTPITAKVERLARAIDPDIWEFYDRIRARGDDDLEVWKSESLRCNGYWGRSVKAAQALLASLSSHDTAEPGLCPRTLEAAAMVAEKHPRADGTSTAGFARSIAAAIRSLSPTTSKGGSRDL